MLNEQSGGVKFRTPATHIRPMRGEGRLLLKFAIGNGFWLAATLAAYAVVTYAVWLWCDPITGIVLGMIVWIPTCVLAVLAKRAVDYARLRSCGSDGLWILLQTSEGQRTLADAARLAREREPYENGAYRDDFPILRRWEIHLQAECRLYGQQQQIIHAWMNSGKPYGPDATRFFP